MKKILTLSIFFIYSLGISQCHAPSDFTVINNISSAELSWTEIDWATEWEIAVTPDFVIGTPLPSSGVITTNNISFIMTGLPSGCNVFYVRSVCFPGNDSPWTMVASSACSPNVIYYITTLSNNNFIINSDSKELKIYPNPSKKEIQLKYKTKIDKIIISDLSGKVILIQTQNTDKIEIEQLSNGMYIVEVFSGEEKFNRKFIKE